LLQDGDVGVGVFPECKEILIGRLGLGNVALQHISATEAKTRKRTDRRVHHNPAMIEDFLKLSGCFVSLVSSEKAFPADINWIERALTAQLVRDRSLKDLDGP